MKKNEWIKDETGKWVLKIKLIEIETKLLVECITGLLQNGNVDNITIAMNLIDILGLKTIQPEAQNQTWSVRLYNEHPTE
jgi:hypothetical protein